MLRVRRWRRLQVWRIGDAPPSIHDIMKIVYPLFKNEALIATGKGGGGNIYLVPSSIAKLKELLDLNDQDRVFWPG